MSTGRIFGRALGTAALLFGGLVGGVSYKSLRAMPPGQPLPNIVDQVRADVASALVTAARGQTGPSTPYETYADVLATLRANYYGKDIDPTQMTYNAVRGMMATTHDPYTRFMAPKAFQELMTENSGQIAGIGALMLTNKANQVSVVKVIPNSPAQRAKVMPGDVVLKVNATPTLKMNIDDVVGLIRGLPGTKVTLTLLRKGTPRPVVLTITRAVVQQQVVQYAMVDPVNKIGYLLLTGFNDESDPQIGKALSALQAQGMRGLVFDLRGNPGGLVDAAQAVASRFIPAGPVFWDRDRTRTVAALVPHNADPDAHRGQLRYPLVVLVNGNSASAAEIVSGAIKDTGAGILVGEKTFGKGIEQTLFNLPDGSGVAITTHHYYTAHKNDIHHKGILPNIVALDTDAALRQRVTYLDNHPNAAFDLKDDPQLQRALAALRRRMQVASARPW